MFISHIIHGTHNIYCIENREFKYAIYIELFSYLLWQGVHGIIEIGIIYVH